MGIGEQQGFLPVFPGFWGTKIKKERINEYDVVLVSKSGCSDLYSLKFPGDNNVIWCLLNN